MSLLEASSWTLEVDRGPEWLFIRVQAPPTDLCRGQALAEAIWQTMQHHMAKRVVLELHNLRLLRSQLLGELIGLQKRIDDQGGVMRVCGLNDTNNDVLRVSGLQNYLQSYRNREEAIMAGRPKQPR